MKSRFLIPALLALPLVYVLRPATPTAQAPLFTPVAAQVAPKGEKAEAVTFNKHIAPILFDNCATCHRAGEVAPFSLTSYDDAKKRARLITQVTQDRLMPPWHADEGSEKFHDARRLSDEQIALIRRWADSGAPQGEAKDLPAVPHFPEGWQLGEPDFVAAPTESYKLEAEGRDVYRCFVVPTNFAEDRWVTAIEVRPGNRKVVHHLIAYLDTEGRARQMDAKDPGPGYTAFGGPGFPPAGSLGGWAPGNLTRPLAPGAGMLLPKGADIILQVHYNKSGKAETDLTKMGLHFAKEPVDKRVRWLMVVNPLLRLPVGENNHVVRALTPVPTDITALAVLPHMHLLGKQMEVTATLPDGAKKKLVNVDRWDFNWQQTYALKEPIKLPKGSRVNLMARYDNSADNPRNPSNPPREVRWGEQTTDEMCIAFMPYTVDAEHITKGQEVDNLPGDFAGGNRRTRPRAGGAGAAGGLDAAAANGEVARQFLKQFDKDGDGKLNDTEREALRRYVREIFGGAAQ